MVAPNAIDFACAAKRLPHEPVPCARMMELCKAVEELRMEFEDLPFEQYRARDKTPADAAMARW